MDRIVDSLKQELREQHREVHEVLRALHARLQCMEVKLQVIYKDVTTRKEQNARKAKSRLKKKTEEELAQEERQKTLSDNPAEDVLSTLDLWTNPTKNKTFTAMMNHLEKVVGEHWKAWVEHFFETQKPQEVLEMLLMLYNTSFFQPWAKRGQGGKYFLLDTRVDREGKSQFYYKEPGTHSFLFKTTISKQWTQKQRYTFAHSRSWLILHQIFVFVKKRLMLKVMTEDKFNGLRRLFGCFSDLAEFKPLPHKYEEYEWTPRGVAPEEDTQEKWVVWTNEQEKRWKKTEDAFRSILPELDMIRQAFVNVFQSDTKSPTFMGMYRSKWSKL